MIALDLNSYEILFSQLFLINNFLLYKENTAQIQDIIACIQYDRWTKNYIPLNSEAKSKNDFTNYGRQSLSKIISHNTKLSIYSIFSHDSPLNVASRDTIVRLIVLTKNILDI